MNFRRDFTFNEITNLIYKSPNTGNNFRYFDKRNEECLKNHIYSFILEDSGDSVGYGHLDFDDVNNNTWLGMCVFDSFQGKGYGKLIIENLIDNRQKKILHLTVDKNNFRAINLYLNYGFKIYSQTSSIFYCRLI